jgi:hypothetical protein
LCATALIANLQHRLAFRRPLIAQKEGGPYQSDYEEQGKAKPWQ